jgi:hypothetical protein
MKQGYDSPKNTHSYNSKNFFKLSSSLYVLQLDEPTGDSIIDSLTVPRILQSSSSEINDLFFKTNCFPTYPKDCEDQNRLFGMNGFLSLFISKVK